MDKDTDTEELLFDYVNKIFWNMAIDNLPSEEFNELVSYGDKCLIDIANIDFDANDWDSFDLGDFDSKKGDEFSEFWIFNNETTRIYAKILVVQAADSEDPEFFIRWDQHYDDWFMQ